MNPKRLILLVAMLLLGLALVACSQQDCPDCPDCPEASCPEADCPECPEASCPECPQPEACPDPVECPSAVQAPFEELWASSGHADVEAEAFRHWDEDDPKVVSARCAKCHSEGGYLDFLGADGTEAGTVDADHSVETTVSCVACHNEATMNKSSVVFPSGVELTGLGPEAVCMECHQGRASGPGVDAQLEELGLTEDLDTVSEDLGFSNIHYFAAAATQAGGMAMGGYQYAGKAYDSRFDHVAGYDTCVGCHNSHTLELKVEECAACHTDADPKDIRMAGSLVDYDGDGDMSEGIYYEMMGLQEALYGAMQAYAADVAGTPIVYDASSYPYFFNDAGENFASWTGRLAKAAYNYQTSLKDPGAFAHGGKYIIQLLFDSIEDLDPALAEGLRRIDHGHFAGSEEAFRHWDVDGAVSASCAKCHSAAGLPFEVEHGVQIEQEFSNGLNCATCHNDLTAFTIHEVASVKFPSGATVDSGSPATNLCINCHQGRESTASVNSKITGADADTVVEGLGFRNVHYFAAGATLFGTEVKGAYEYADNEYLGRNEHVPGFNNCTDCHSTHQLEVKTESCATCHPGVEPAGIRMDATDWDGDGDTAEGIAGEIATMTEELYAALQAYAANTVGTPIVYESHSYPYFFIDTDGDGAASEGEATRSNGYATWSPRLLSAAYNYQYVLKDPGAFAHNGKYVIQFLYDALADLGADVSGMTRP